jgi:hypothetical protein
VKTHVAGIGACLRSVRLIRNYNNVFPVRNQRIFILDFGIDGKFMLIVVFAG